MVEFGVVLLAAGDASRMGSPKQLLDFGGMPLVRHAVVQALGAQCSPVVVVCGARHEEIRAALNGLPAEIVVNERWAEGMGTSIQCGLRQLEASGVTGMILSLADQPLIDSATYQRLMEIHAETSQPIVAAQYEGTVGVPVLFTREYFPHLLALAPAQGCKGVIQGHRAQAALFDCPDAAADVDTPEDFARVLAEFQRRNLPASTNRVGLR